MLTPRRFSCTHFTVRACTVRVSPPLAAENVKALVVDHLRISANVTSGSMARTTTRVLAVSCCSRATQISRRQFPLASASRERKMNTTHAFFTPSVISDRNWSLCVIIWSSYQTSSRMRFSMTSRISGPTSVLWSFHEWLKKIPGTALKISRIFRLSRSPFPTSSTPTRLSQSLRVRIVPSVMSSPTFQTHSPSGPENCTSTSCDSPGKRLLMTLSIDAQRLRSSPTVDATTTICTAPSSPAVSASWKNSCRSAVACSCTLSRQPLRVCRRRCSALYSRLDICEARMCGKSAEGAWSGV
mmetsp:Transcript_6091/g.14485  ORF Transcript_6091/g.14485 Transcript_6091/m.14485 type:complete len:299 (-) Transcript_6091:701-1597(-)